MLFLIKFFSTCKLKAHFGLWLLIFPVLPLMGQKKELQFDHLTIEHGLSNSIVLDIFQDSKGYMWFATANGLNRYDGYEFKIFRTERNDPNSISANRIFSMIEDRDGDLIVSTWDAGLCVYNYKTGHFTRYQNNPDNPNSLPVNGMRKVILDNDGKIWIASITAGLIYFDKKNKRFRSFNPPKYEGSKQLSSLSLTVDGQIIVPYVDEGVFLFNPKNEKFTRLVDRTPDIPIHNSLTSKYVTQTSDNKIWIGTEGDGVYVYDMVYQTSKHYINLPEDPNSLGSNVVRDIIEDDNGEIWLATDGGGLNRYMPEEEKFERYQSDLANPFSLSTNQLYRLYLDNSGIFWIGTFSGGINIYNPNKNKFKVYKPRFDDPNSLSYQSVLAIFEDRDKNIWIGTDGGGINLFNPDKFGEKFIHYKNELNNSNSLVSNIVKSICQDSDGILWFGTYQNGLDRYDPKTNKFTNISPNGRPDGLPTGLVWAMLEDSKGNFWVSCLGAGVSILDRKNLTFKTYRPTFQPGAISQVNVMVIFEDRQNRIWMGTEGGGLNLYNPEKDNFIAYHYSSDNPNSISNEDIRAIYQDKKDNLWIGTNGGGLNMLTPDLKTFKHYTIYDGLPANVIYGILEDDDGILWLSTTNGVSRFNPESGTFRNYDKLDGLQSNEFTYTASCKTSDRKLLFGGIEGFNMFKPADIKDNMNIPPVYITELLIFNKPVVPGDEHYVLEVPVDQVKEIRLPYDYSVFTLRFTAINYTHTSKNRYSFFLENFEKEWNEAGLKREATYTNLDPGTYFFHVRACNNDGIWNMEGTSLKIIVDPPWYLTTWAKLIYLFLVFLILFLLVLYVLNLFRRQTRKLEIEKKRKLQAQQKQFEEEAMKAEKEILKLQQEKLKNEISYKTNELASLALHYSHKNETLIAIKENLEKISEVNPQESYQLVKQIINSIQNDLELDENWNQFELHFDEVHENFLKRFKERYPDLRPIYLKLCAYIRMKLTSKQIASLMNTSLASVEKNRYRLKEKLNLAEGIKLTDFIEKF